ncbi:MAG TPA: tetratricopeptide repeat protein [Bryobacteraceae bacterium]
MPPQQSAPRVFISYSHDSPEHEAKVLDLAKRLRGDGVVVTIDKDELFPENGWLEWMRKQIDAAQFVLVICTEKYGRDGRGATREGATIDQNLYEARGRNRKFIPVLMREEDAEHRPEFLRPYTFFVMDRDYAKLLQLLKPEPPEPVAIWNIPSRNDYFSGRDDYIESLRRTLAQGGSAALTQPQAIRGLGGIGKSQTAIEYAYRYRDEYSSGFWMTADSREALVSGFAALGPQEEQDLGKAARIGKRWFEENSGWLLILDNVEDWSVVKEWIPAGRRGHVVITTRLQSTGTIAKGIDLPKMKPDEGAEFLLRRAKIESARQADRASAREVSVEVAGLPLALDQAGAFMEEVRIAPAEYLKLYRAEGKKLRERRGEGSADHDSVAVTYTLAFEKLGERAKDIVRMCAFLAPDAIPEEILTSGREPGLEFHEAIGEAVKFSLIGRDPAAKTIDIHRLVQDVVKDGMDAAARRSWSDRAVEALDSAFPSGEFGTWPQCERLLPHAKLMLALVEEHGIESAAASRLLNEAACYLLDRAQYREAEPLYQKSLAIAEKVFGPDYPETASRLNNLAELYRDQGRYGEALPLYQRALAIAEKALGADHPRTATCLNNLAALYDDQGRDDEAEPLYRRAIAIAEKALGPDHPSTAIHLNSLALLYKNQGRYEEAEPLHRRALAINENALGADHLDTARSLNNLAYLQEKQDRYDEAEPLFQRALQIYEAALGPDHPETITCRNKYADLLGKLGREPKTKSAP